MIYKGVNKMNTIFPQKVSMMRKENGIQIRLKAEMTAPVV